MDKLLEMRVGSSTIGKTKNEMIKHFIQQDKITDPELLDIVNGGTKTHEKIEADMLKAGIAIDVEREIKDEENGIVGYYDVRMKDRSSITGEAIMDIKTISSKGFEEVKKNKAPKDLHQRQVNWYLHHTNKLNKGYVMYVNRDNPEEVYSVGFKYDKKMYESSMATLKDARNEVRTMIDNGQLSRSDLYKPIDKYRILADVAPYSDEFREMNQMMSAMQLNDKEQIEVRAIRDRAAKVKEPLRLYDYRFKHDDVMKEKVKLGNRIDKLMFNVEGSDTPIKLSGVKLNKEHPKYKEAVEFLETHMDKGSNVTIQVSRDLKKRKNDDQLGTTKAVVFNHGMNINKELIKRGLAEEDKDDFSPTGVHARFNSLQRTFGKAWESIAHFDSYANTKLLQVRSAAEDYERKHVYGKKIELWHNPIV